jgi:hypothetical protein
VSDIRKKYGVEIECRKGRINKTVWWYRLKLDQEIKESKKEEKDNDDELSFLDEGSAPVDKTNELKFNVVKEVYIAKKEEMEAIRNEATKRENNQKILQLIAEKQEGDLRGKSIEELTAMLQD